MRIARIFGIARGTLLALSCAAAILAMGEVMAASSDYCWQLLLGSRGCVACCAQWLWVGSCHAARSDWACAIGRQLDSGHHKHARQGEYPDCNPHTSAFAQPMGTCTAYLGAGRVRCNACSPLQNELMHIG